MKNLITILLLPLSVALAAPSATEKRAPTRSFTIQAFQSPAPGGLTGYYLSASAGKFKLVQNSPNTKPVLNVDHQGQASLTVRSLSHKHAPASHVYLHPSLLQTPTAAQIFIDTTDGRLGYGDLPPGSSITNFLHLGAGTILGTSSEPPSKFQWIGSDNSGWFACSTGTGSYQLYKQMTVSTKDLDACAVVELGALDA